MGVGVDRGGNTEGTEPSSTSAAGAPAAATAVVEEGDEEAPAGATVGGGELCVVCLVRRRKAVFLPCGHRVCCITCSRLVCGQSVEPSCPICRGLVLGAVRVYDS